MSAPNGRRPPIANISSAPRRTPTEDSHNRMSTNASLPSTTAQGLARSPSTRGRVMRRSTNRVSSSLASSEMESEQEDDAKAATAQIIADLKEQTHRAEQAAENYRRELEVMKQRFEAADGAVIAAEHKQYDQQTKFDELRYQLEMERSERRQLEKASEDEKDALIRDHERLTRQDEDNQKKIALLNERLRERLPNVPPKPPPSVQPSDWSEELPDSNAIAQAYALKVAEKDAIIQKLSFELAEMELEVKKQLHKDESGAHNLQKENTQLQQQVARLQDENESYQVLLQDKALKGELDFSPGNDASEQSENMVSLADELERAADGHAGDWEEICKAKDRQVRELLRKIKNLEERVTGLTLYIDKFTGRVLNTPGFEHLIVNADEVPEPLDQPTTFPLSQPSNTPTALQQKPLPATPPVPDQTGAPLTSTTNQASALSSAAGGFLKRTSSLFSKAGGKPRPMSYMQPLPPPPSQNENPDTAPSIPLGRGHRRARSDQAQNDLGAAALVQQMNRGSPLRTVSGGPMSPSISPLGAGGGLARPGSYFTSASGSFQQQQPPPAPATGASSLSARPTSGSGQPGDRGSSANSVASSHSLDARDSTDLSSIGPSREHHGSNNPNPNIPGAVMNQRGLRPLRLGRKDTIEEEEMQKRANRGSWMGWLKGASIEAQNDTS